MTSTPPTQHCCPPSPHTLHRVPSPPLKSIVFHDHLSLCIVCHNHHNTLHCVSSSTQQPELCAIITFQPVLRSVITTHHHHQHSTCIIFKTTALCAIITIHTVLCVIITSTLCIVCHNHTHILHCVPSPTHTRTYAHSHARTHARTHTHIHT